MNVIERHIHSFVFVLHQVFILTAHKKEEAAPAFLIVLEQSQQNICWHVVEGFG